MAVYEASRRKDQAQDWRDGDSRALRGDVLALGKVYAEDKERQGMPTSYFCQPRPVRLRALAAKLRLKKPNDPAAEKLALNLEAAAKYLLRRKPLAYH